MSNVVYLLDPPYLSTDTKTYTNMDYWRLGDHLDILKMLEDNVYFYFTSEKSQIVELAAWLSENGFKKNPFAGATTKVVQTTLNHATKYNDIMIFKNQTRIKQLLITIEKPIKKAVQYQSDCFIFLDFSF